MVSSHGEPTTLPDLTVMTPYQEEMADTEEFVPNEDARPVCDCGDHGKWQRSADGTSSIFSCDACHQEAIESCKEYADKFRIPAPPDAEKYYYRAAGLID